MQNYNKIYFNTLVKEKTGKLHITNDKIYKWVDFIKSVNLGNLFQHLATSHRGMCAKRLVLEACCYCFYSTYFLTHFLKLPSAHNPRYSMQVVTLHSPATAPWLQYSQLRTHQTPCWNISLFWDILGAGTSEGLNLDLQHVNLTSY